MWNARVAGSAGALRRLLIVMILGAAAWMAACAHSVSTAAPPAVDPFRKGPYLIAGAGPGQVKVLWQLADTAPATCQWGPDSTCAAGIQNSVEYGADHQHAAVLDGLPSGRRTYYRVTARGVSRGGSFMAAEAPASTRLKFLVYGDTRSDPATHESVAAAMTGMWAADPACQSFTLSVGDLVENGTVETDWTRQFFTAAHPGIGKLLAGAPYLSCIGNHEGNGGLFVKYFPYPFVAGRYWSFDDGPAHVVMVDQYTSLEPGSPQAEWIDRDLAGATRPWRFLCLHAPGWSAGGDHPDNVTVRNVLQPLCRKYGVAIVFAGHNHYYARNVVDGVQHVTTGGGGAPLYALNPSAPNLVASASVYHFCAVDIAGDSLSFRALKPDGTVIDSFRMAVPVAAVSRGALIPAGAGR